jgi:hypothetical protein
MVLVMVLAVAEEEPLGQVLLVLEQLELEPYSF